MVQYINANGGWTIVGWFKLGEVADAADEKEKVVNTEVTVRLSYLYPSRGSSFINSQEFREKQIRRSPPSSGQRPPSRQIPLAQNEAIDDATDDEEDTAQV